MAVSHFFRDIIFLTAGRSQLDGLYGEISINDRSCDPPFGTHNKRETAIYIYMYEYAYTHIFVCKTYNLIYIYTYI